MQNGGKETMLHVVGRMLAKDEMVFSGTGLISLPLTPSSPRIWHQKPLHTPATTLRKALKNWSAIECKKWIEPSLATLQLLSQWSCCCFRNFTSNTRTETSCSDRRFWFSYILFIIIIGEILVKVKQPRYRPGVTQRVPEVRVPRFHDNGTGWWQGCQPYAPAAFTPRKYTWYSFLLEAESPPGS